MLNYILEILQNGAYCRHFKTMVLSVAPSAYSGMQSQTGNDRVMVRYVDYRSGLVFVYTSMKGGKHEKSRR